MVRDDWREFAIRDCIGDTIDPEVPKNLKVLWHFRIYCIQYNLNIIHFLSQQVIILGGYWICRHANVSNYLFNTVNDEKVLRVIFWLKHLA
jgi:hypothetical protein